MIKKIVKDTIEKHHMIEPGDTVLLGLSGGPDSVCLFDVLKKLAAEMKFQLCCAHVNHMFRPGAAEEDQAYVEKLCLDNEISCYSKVVDCNQMARESGMSGEEAGREARYSFFAEVIDFLEKKGIQKEKIKIAIAQNLDDQVETVLFRILRGTGIDGIAGIDYMRSNKYGNVVVRPLLDVRKKDILQYCQENRLQPRFDHTNQETVYTRNKIRLQLIPTLEKEYNSNISEAVKRLGEAAKSDKEYIWSQVNTVFDEICTKSDSEEVWLDQSKLRELHPAVMHRVIAKAFGIIGLFGDITNAHYKQAQQLITSGETPQHMDLPKGYVLRISYGSVICGRKREEFYGQEDDFRIKVVDIENYVRRKGCAAFDYDQLCGAYGREDIDQYISVRCRQQRDFIKLKGMKGRKKIQDLFVDMKVPAYRRDEVVMAAVGHEILWITDNVCKERFSGNYSVNEQTKRVVIVEKNL